MRTMQDLLIAAVIALMLSPAFPIIVFAGDKLDGGAP